MKGFLMSLRLAASQAPVYSAFLPDHQHGHYQPVLMAGVVI
jgi:hypothetical protein